MARKLHNTEVDVTILKTSQDSEHGEFLIIERNKAHHDEIKGIHQEEIFNFLSMGITYKDMFLDL